ncbi:MAG: hypothetical protein KJ709_06555 [Nanoarchaeota archaeon]|nr:hypothetical protein [Nanoarchaeota archaeon]
MVKKTKKSSRMALYMTLFMVFIMVTSLAGFLAPDEGSDFKYGKYKFTAREDAFYTSIDGKQFRFYHTPELAENVTFDTAAKDKIFGSRMILVSFEPSEDPVFDLVRFELSQEMPELFSVFVASGIALEDDRYDLPVISCLNATEYVPVIMLLPSNESSVTIDDDCIAISGSEDGLLLAKDRLMYSLAGILDGE